MWYFQDKKNSLFSVSQEMLEATSTDPAENITQESPATTSDYCSNFSNSPNSDLYLEEDLKLQNKEEVEESDGNNNIQQEEGNIDSDSLDDEGLGDISSEGENAESPEPNEPTVPTKCPGEITVNTSCESSAGAKTSGKSDELSAKLYQESEKERRPSRISFETPF